MGCKNAPVTDERWRISVDHQKCQGTAMCAALAPAYFEVRDGLSEPIGGEVEPDEDVRDAAEQCPLEAIMVTSAEDGRLVAPEPY